MTSQTVSDAARIRALAHPLRLTLLELLRDEEDLTATRAAALTGESAASCSFHLRMLAKYGFAERAAARGKEKPWRAVGPTSHRFAPEPGNPASRQAVGEVADLVLAREFDRIRAFLDLVPTESEEWVLASTMASSTFWATREELLALSEEISRLTERFEGRREDPGLRPPGARLARLFAAAHPEPVRAEVPA